MVEINDTKYWELFLDISDGIGKVCLFRKCKYQLQEGFGKLLPPKYSVSIKSQVVIFEFSVIETLP